MISPRLTPEIVLIVIGAGALHACWNAVAKQAEDRLLAFGFIGVAAALGGGAVLAVTGLPYRAAIPFAIASAAIHVGYDLALLNSYRLGAFNHTYPIARGTSPLLVAAGAYLFAGERLSPAGLAGVTVLAAGLVALALSAGRLTRAALPAAGAAALTGVTIASYTLVDGLGVRQAHDPWAYAGLLFALHGPFVALAAAARRPPRRWLDRSTARSGLLAGVLSLAAYGIVLWAQTRAPLAEVAAIRETSVIFAALIGMVFLREQFGPRRAAAAAVIAAGIILMAA
ncbi:MAG: EamA family transporter [Streptosporangiaceae bacterium]